MSLVYFITHPDVIIDPEVSATQWPLSPRGKERMRKLLTQSWLTTIEGIYCSTEQKAIDGAEILAEYLGIGYQKVVDIGEIDRSATGYLPYEAFMAVYEQFMAHPDKHVRGWEPAREAQQRIIGVIGRLVDKSEGNIALVSHGAVGALYLCYLKGRAISMIEEQPSANGGNYYCFEPIF